MPCRTAHCWQTRERLGMSEFDSPGMTLEPSAKRRSPGSRFAEFGDRIARSFAGLDRPKAAGGVWAPAGDPEPPEDDQSTAQWEELQPQFPVVRHGYDPGAVDEYILELERELDTLRSARPDQRAIAHEIDRIGEQTGTTIELTTVVDPEILGGIVLRVGNFVLDASIRNRLEQLRKQVAQG